MPRVSTPRTSEAVARFMAQQRRKTSSESMLYGYQSLLNRFTRAMNDCQVGSITAPKVDDFFYGPGGLAETCARQTLGKYRNELKGFLTFCHRNRWTTETAEQLLSGITDKSTRANKRRYRLTAQQLRDVLDAAPNPRDRALTAFMVETGCRISEAQYLRVKDIAFNKGEIYVYEPKTREETTRVMTLGLEAELRAWLTAYAENIGRPLSPDDYLFPNRENLGNFVNGKNETSHKRWNPKARLTNPARIIKAMTEAAGVELPKGSAWHTLRRSAANVLYENASEMGHDRSARIVQTFLRHKNLATTEIYLDRNLDEVMVERMLKGRSFIVGAMPENVTAVDFSERKSSNG